MKISIIIPSHNTEKLLEDCIVSIYKETLDLDYEVIVVDNGSEYNIKSQIQKIKNTYKKFQPKAGRPLAENIKLIQNKNNLGFAKACNQGIEKAKGEYLLFLNSDTIILDRAINKSVEIIEKNKNETSNNIDILGCQLLNPDKSIQPSAGYFPKLRQIFLMMFFLDDLPVINSLVKPYHQQNRGFYKKEREVDWVTGAFLMAKSEVVKKIKGFDERYFMYAEEVDLCFRAKRAGFKVYFEPEPKIIHLKEASPRSFEKKAVLAEFEGLKLFYRCHKPSWEMPVLRFFLKIGGLLRVAIFGILLGNAEKRKVYWKAFQLA